MDLFPTFYSVTGVQIEENLYLDGVNLIPYIKGEKENAPHDTLFWMIHNQGAVRMGDWKLIIESDTSMQLYNLRDDLPETHDLAMEYQDIVEQLLQSWKDWNEPFPVSTSKKTKFTVK
jgi:arylsulfatase A-like enzyme